jgi:hypothetical protein
MVPYAKDKFNIDGSLWTFSFQRDDRGKITGVTRFDKRYNTLSQSWKRLETEIK